MVCWTDWIGRLTRKREKIHSRTLEMRRAVVMEIRLQVAGLQLVKNRPTTSCDQIEVSLTIIPLYIQIHFQKKLFISYSYREQCSVYLTYANADSASSLSHPSPNRASINSLTPISEISGTSLTKQSSTIP